ncbi:hypothetical protein NPIL_208101 [Nephila pilipes]|uniref:Uncharacterized protein n=1 Tax=Nephila pilipes TaxID=299642 RepID=A0A8X6NUF7_NEPPI|nr:hypothetical protein NPIL_208101 [Nephila pilipes]
MEKLEKRSEHNAITVENLNDIFKIIIVCSNNVAQSKNKIRRQPCEHFHGPIIVFHYDMLTESDTAWSPYSPDLTACDFSFGNTRNAICIAKIHKQLRNWNTINLSCICVKFRLKCSRGCMRI